ncbi:GxxExxY protein [Marinilabilia sp.]|uniref:GxxExxY protein n=1 Tax=Marinilabilia sp. TaxID=2021252 RepID=UPI0025C10179|nr:GxxExxY protein [Marinilabilia sp.]
MPDLLAQNQILYKDESYKIIGAAFEVHNELGCGFLEAVYQEALEIEFQNRNIPYQREAPLKVNYKGHTLKKEYTADFICYGKIIIETKALCDLNSEHESQVHNYLKATNFKLGILINFGDRSLKHKRIVR